MDRAKVVQLTLSDDADSAGALGYEEFDFTYDVASVVNHFTVKWAGGEVVETNEHRPDLRVEPSIQHEVRCRRR